LSLPDVIDYVEFDIENEPWEKYRLSDGSILKTRTVVTQIVKTGQYDPFGKPTYGVLANVIHSIQAPREFRGKQPTIPPPSPQQLGEAIVEEVTAQPTGEVQLNTYNCNDGTILRIQTIFTSIKRTNLFDTLGESLYIINTQHVIKENIPKHLWKSNS